MRSYRRRLPHLDEPGVPVFVTWRLWGSLPPGRSFQHEHVTSGQAFVALDQLLDTARTGALYLRQPEIASLVVTQLQEIVARGACTLQGYVIMPNHVHVLWTPRVSLCDLVRQVKGPTAVRANRLLARTGRRFWQEEYFDRLVTDEKGLARILHYIEWNPVRAGLSASPEAFPWSSAGSMVESD